jgi:phenylalanine-4-hydroxylase
MYEAIRLLSIEEAEDTPQATIDAEKKQLKIYNMGEYLDGSNKKPLVDCGIRLIGTVENPKIYGAGLLSSIGESAHCMTDQVEKFPYDITIKVLISQSCNLNFM